jgi:hypothetical protein
VSTLSSILDMTDPEPKSKLSFIVGCFKNADEIYKMFSSQHGLDHLENDEMILQILFRMKCYANIASTTELLVNLTTTISHSNYFFESSKTV